MPDWIGPPLHGRFAEADRSPFVGRQREVASIEDAWELVAAAHRQAIFISGEPGAGKSRLAAETAKALLRNDAVVLVGTSSPDLAYPYQPLAQAIDALLRSAEPGALRRLLPTDADQLLRLTDSVLLHDPVLEISSAKPNQTRLELFAAVTDLLRNVAAERPIALFLEDLHWSTPETRSLLSHLIRHTDQTSLLVVGTMRTNVPDRSDELAFAIADLYRLPGVRRIDLTGLDSEAIEEFLAASSGAQLPNLRETAALLRDRTGGNPFFISELWKDIERAGGYQSLRSPGASTPQSVIDTIEVRLGQLDPSIRNVLNLAAVLGERFDGRDLGPQGDAIEILNALDSAATSGLISRDSKPSMYVFSHSLVRQAMLDRMTGAESASAHEQLALRLCDSTDGVIRPAHLLARLFTGALALGYSEQASKYVELAANEAGIGLAHEEQASLLEKAANFRGVDETRRQALLMKAALAHRRAGDFSDARRLYSQVFETASGETALTAAIGFEDASWRPGLHGERARVMLQTALKERDEDPSDPLYILAIASLSRALTFSGELEQSGPLAVDALRMARLLGQDELIAEALVATLLRVITIPATTAANYHHAAELRELVLRIPDYDKLGPSGTYRANAAYMSGARQDWADGIADIALAGERTGQAFWEWVTGCYEFSTKYMDGDMPEAARIAESIRLLGASFGADDTEGPYGIQMFLVKREVEDLERVRPLIVNGIATQTTWDPGLLALATELSLSEMAGRLLRSLLATDRIPYSGTAVWPAVLVFLTEAALYLEDTEALSRVLPMLEEYDGYNLIVGASVAVFGSANRYIAQVHAASGNVEMARHHFEKALEGDTAMRSQLHEAESAAAYAAWLANSASIDDVALSSDLATRARGIAEPRNLARILRRIAEIREPGLPDQLTPRELDVLRLLADGASNRRIGDELYISQNTAANHVRNILMKTASSNRTQAAMYAANKGLIDTPARRSEQPTPRE